MNFIVRLIISSLKSVAVYVIPEVVKYGSSKIVDYMKKKRGVK